MKIKIWSPEELAEELRKQQGQGRKIVFTNGCFDLLHVGHVRYLQEAKALADLLVVAVNSDRSVRRLKGPNRPIQLENHRAEILNALQCVDYVIVFDEDTPYSLIERLKPDVLVKGADWENKIIVGRDIVEQAGGCVKTIPYIEGNSSTALIDKIRGLWDHHRPEEK